MTRDPLAPQFAALHAEVANLAAAGIVLALRQRILRQIANVSDFDAQEPMSDLVMRAAELLAEIERVQVAAQRLDRRLLH